MIDVLVEMMLTTRLQLSGKSNQCRFSPVIFQVAQAIWSASNSTHKEMRTIMSTCFPSIRTLQCGKKESYVSDDKISKPYTQRKASRNVGKKSKEQGYSQVDKMKLKHGIFWNMKTGEAIGLANDILDMDTMIRRILWNDGDNVEVAVYANQWQYVSFTPGGLEIWTCDHSISTMDP